MSSSQFTIGLAVLREWFWLANLLHLIHVPDITAPWIEWINDRDYIFINLFEIYKIYKIQIPDCTYYCSDPA